MANRLTLLQAVEIILRDLKRPLHAMELVDEIRRRSLTEISGETPWKTVNARISVDIRRNRNTTFKRVAPATYGLTSFPQEEYAPKTYSKRYSHLFDDQVLVFPSVVLDDVGYFHGINKDYTRYHDALLSPTSSKYPRFWMYRDVAERDFEHKQIVCYVLVKYRDSLLRYRRGARTSLRDNTGIYSIGFGGHLECRDLNFWSIKDGDFGYTHCVSREIQEEIGVRVEDTRIRSSIVGALNDDSVEQGRQHFAFVHVLELSKPDYEKSERWINDLKLVRIADLGSDFERYEYWSQLCIQAFFGQESGLNCRIETIDDLALRSNRDIILVTGYIGSGKTEACTLLEQEFGYRMIRCSRIMQRVIGCGSIEEIGRGRLQDIGHKFICEQNGHERLARAIVEYMNAHGCGSRFVLDGLRYPETLLALEAVLGRTICVIYVDTLVEKLYKFYQDRDSTDHAFSTFLNVVHHPVERQIERFRPIADIIVHNNGSLDSYLRELRRYFLVKMEGLSGT